MRKFILPVLVGLFMMFIGGSFASAQPTGAETALDTKVLDQKVTLEKAPSAPWGYAGAGIGAGLVVLGLGVGIGRIGGSACEALARQPEVSNKIQTMMLLAAALIEGAGFFALVITLLIVLLK